MAEILQNGGNMVYFKAALEYGGIKAGHMRKPLLDFLPREKEALLIEFKSMCKKSRCLDLFNT